MEINDIFESTFNSNCKEAPFMTTDGEFENFMAHCKDKEIINASDDDSMMRQAWSRCISFKSKESIKVRYNDLYNALCDIDEKNAKDPNKDYLMLNLKRNVCELSSMITSWTSETYEDDDDSEETLKKVMDKVSLLYMKLDKVISQNTSLMNGAALDAVMENVKNLVLQKLKAKEINQIEISPYQYKREHFKEIEKKSRSNDQTKNNAFGEMIERAIKNGKSAKDIYGHALQHANGIVSAIVNKTGSSSVEVVALPKGTSLPPTTLSHAYNIYAAHKDLSLSKHFPDVYGNDFLSSPVYSFVLYEYCKGRSLHDVIKNNRLSESNILFKYWAKEILHAFWDLSQMLNYQLEEIPDLNNIFIAESGSRVIMGNLKFLHPLNVENHENISLLQLQSKLLMASYGNILLSLISERDLQSNKKGDRKGGSVNVYREKENKKEINVEMNECFEIHIQCQSGKVFESPLILLSPSSAALDDVVLCLNANSLHVENGEYKFNFQAKNVGDCSILLFSRFPYDHLSSIPDYVFNISVKYAKMSPTLEAIITASQYKLKNNIHHERKRLGEYKEEDEETIKIKKENEKRVKHKIESVSKLKEEKEEYVYNNCQPTFQSLLTHPYFSQSHDLFKIMETFDHTFKLK